MRASNHNVYFAWTDSSFPAISRPFCPCINARRPSSCVGDYLRYLTCPAFPYLEPVNARSFQQKRTFWHPRWIACHRDRVSLLFPSLGHPRAMTLIFAPVDLPTQQTHRHCLILPPNLGIHAPPDGRITAAVFFCGAAASVLSQLRPRTFVIRLPLPSPIRFLEVARRNVSSGPPR